VTVEARCRSCSRQRAFCVWNKPACHQFDAEFGRSRNLWRPGNEAARRLVAAPQLGRLMARRALAISSSVARPFSYSLMTW